METKDLIYELFSICDKYVDVDDFVQFEKEFAEVVKKTGLDLYEIYYNESFESLKKRFKRYSQVENKEIILH